jgi:hypothetical protein
MQGYFVFSVSPLVRLRSVRIFCHVIAEKLENNFKTCNSKIPSGRLRHFFGILLE